MLKINNQLTPRDLEAPIKTLWTASAEKIRSIEARSGPENPTPVYTVDGQYTARGWTEWTEGFVYGSAILQFDATEDPFFLDLGRRHTVEKMAKHLTHLGVHDHGFNNISTFGNLWRLMQEGRIEANAWETHFYEVALKCSGAAQASRWTSTADGGGFIHSFNGAHSLFADTIRSLRSLALAHKLGHLLMGEQDLKISLLERLIQHARVTAENAVYYGEGRDSYDERGRTAHESLFNVANGQYRAPSTQQGYAPFSTWTRGLAWIMCGYAELLEFVQTLPEEAFEAFGGKQAVEQMLLKPALATCDFYIANTPTDGIPYWDTGAPALHLLGDYLNRPADPFNDHEPVDSSAASIAAQGLLRLGSYLKGKTDSANDGTPYFQAGLTILEALFKEPYLSLEASHEGLVLHSIYHRPNGWDFVPEGRKSPCGEASMWGDYHAREVALYVQRLARDEPYLTFFGR